MATASPPPITGSVTSCDAIYQYSPYDGSLESVVVSWTLEQVSIIAHGHTCYYITQLLRSFLEEVEYTVIIDDGAGSSVRERVTCSSTPCSYTYHPAESSRREFGVSVETSGCVTREIVCTERPVCESAVVLVRVYAQCSITPRLSMHDVMCNHVHIS